MLLFTERTNTVSTLTSQNEILHIFPLVKDLEKKVTKLRKDNKGGEAVGMTDDKNRQTNAASAPTSLDNIGISEDISGGKDKQRLLDHDQLRRESEVGFSEDPRFVRDDDRDKYGIHILLMTVYVIYVP